MFEVKPAQVAYFVVFAGVCVALHVTKFSPALPALTEQFGLTSTQAGFLLSLIQLAGMFLGLLMGAMVELIGHRRGMLIGVFVFLITTLLGMFAQSAFFLLLLRGFEGLGFLLVVMPAPAMIRRLVTVHDLPKMMALWSAYMPFGAAASLIVGSILIELLNWQAWWCLLTGLTLILLVCLYKVLPAKKRQEEAASSKGFAIELKQEAVSFLSRVVRTLKSSGSWYVSVGFCMYSAQWLTIVGFLPMIFVQLGITGVASGLVAGLIAGVNIVGNLASGQLISRGVAPFHILAIAFITMAVCGVFAFTTLNFSGLGFGAAKLLAIFVFSCVGGAIPATLFYLFTQVTPSPETMSTTVGLAQQFSSLGQFCAPPIIGALADLNRGDWSWTWVFLLACSLMGLILAQKISSFLAEKMPA